MRLTRVHVDLPLAPGSTLRLPEDASAHLVRVLRLSAGDACVLFNGDGNDYRSRLTAASKREVAVEVLAAEPANTESPLRLVLAQAIARGEKMDWILQKATELGVSAIAPIVTERTEVRLDGERGEKRLAHWRGVVVAACQQSGRARIPRIAEPRSLADWCASLANAGPGKHEVRLALDPGAELSVSRVLPPDTGQALVLAVGPEGGLSERDLLQLRQTGFVGLHLGPRILRTETAGMAALAALQAVFGDLA